MAAMHSFAVVLPTLPVTAMKVVRNIIRRHTNAAAYIRATLTCHRARLTGRRVRRSSIGPQDITRLEYKMMLKWPDVLNLAKNGNPAPDRKVVKTDAEWRKQLSDEEYHVTREAGTERAFSSAMCSLFEPGIYSCLCCETVLFDASEKFESHTGWPSFTQPILANVIAYRFDGPAFLKRVETICNTCDAHLGHVFPDGPPPSGLRYCMNAVALRKVAKV